ncbi:hypothetical protein ASF88_12055 [Leifsonia sp. Leaf336]|uniref:hypothetical protein n=1 Tax=Leifsonia sp. Leaf336 TaxID=1736341 RepID=UPI0007020D0A|nr:hypothetical protein [Leifsonia sp. Leaf336]KQR52282.1 hypothetical protein ASF88_12055 [Leifsonia sp. Leaf336]
MQGGSNAGDGESRPTTEESGDGLLGLLDVIEEQPLSERAAAYTQLHAELSARLEGADAPRHG